MAYEWAKGTRILTADQITLPTGDFDRVQFAAVHFAQGQTPALWKNFDESNWAGLSEKAQKQMAEELAQAIRGGHVKELMLSFDSWGEDYFLSAACNKGWAALLYNACDECVAAPCDPDRPDGWEDAPVDIGGQTPVPRICAIEDMEKAARIISCFLETGTLSPETKWAVNTVDLPWNF